MAKLGDVEFESMATAIEELLERRGLDLASTPWLRALGDGLYEFRVRHTGATIRALYVDSGVVTGDKTFSKVLLRLFVHFHGRRVILLLHGYDKGRDDSARRQQTEIEVARKRLRAWRLRERGRVDGPPRKSTRRNR